MKRLIVMTSVFVMVGSTAFGFGIPKIPGTGTATTAASGPSVDQLQSQLGNISKDYYGATKSFMMSMSSAQDAFGLKKEAALLKSEADQVGSGVLAGSDVEKVTVTLGEAKKTIEQRLKSGEKLTAEGKDKLVQSMGYLAKGIALEVPMVGVVANLSKQAVDGLKSAPVTQIGKAKDIASILGILGTNVPKDLSLAKDTLGLYVDYAKANNIEIPKDVTNIFASN